MNTRKNLIIANGKIITSETRSCTYNSLTKKRDVEFVSGKKYSYAYNNVEWLIDPEVLNPNMYRIRKAGKELFDVREIYVFRGRYDEYWHICFGNGNERDYLRRELEINQSCLMQGNNKQIFEYLKQISFLSDVKNEETGENLLAKRYEQIEFVGEGTVLARYLNPYRGNSPGGREVIPIFPFGCNKSQYMAVKNALENQISVIQGPPGTGKTQTILNIIANILVQEKTVLIVSNNNSATENVYEKLSSPKYNLGFIAATLGKAENKKEFISEQSGSYPDFSSWLIKDSVSLESIRNKSMQLRMVFERRERLALCKQELAQLELERQYFNQYLQETNVSIRSLKLKKNISSKEWMTLWQECQQISENEGRISFLFKIKSFAMYGISDWKFYKQGMADIITTFQAMFYQYKCEELKREIFDIEKYLQDADKVLLDELCNQSMAVLKDSLARKYANRRSRSIFHEEDLWKNSDKVLEEYPVILSTTFSSRNCLNKDVVYDYLIMDEASQVDVATGALALSCARNAVIVGDTKQLPNVVTEDVKKRADAIFHSFYIHRGYHYTNSFLQSILDIIPNVTQTLLREHYRCHPKIINFCNQKFYKGELLIMTEDKGEEDVLKVVKTAKGNHARDHYSQRQIDVIRNEIIPQLVNEPDEIGIITPYKNQVKELKKEFTDIAAATVHKFQGKEKDTIIISTVDDEITDFADDPYLINVAVSRAKKKLLLVVSGNEQSPERNISDLISYIQYNNFEVYESKVYSVFDYLYSQYTIARQEYLKKCNKISEFDSENLMYALIREILKEEEFVSLNVASHMPLSMIIRNPEFLNEKECKYAMNPATHVDFIIYNKISKNLVLAVEVDGYKYHKPNTVQAERDVLKNHILDRYQIPLLRFWSNGSGEREILTKKLKEIMA